MKADLHTAGYSKYSKPTDDHGSSGFACWWFRWHDACPPGKWLLTLDYDAFRRGSEYDVELIPAVVDDFGNLRRVQ